MGNRAQEIGKWGERRKDEFKQTTHENAIKNPANLQENERKIKNKLKMGRTTD